MSSGYSRPLSPPRTNRYHPPAGRTSAGSFFNTSGYDPYGAPTRTSREYVGGPRLSDERVAAPRLLPPRTRSPPRRVALDDYEVPLRARPRRSTLEPEPQRVRRPVSMIAPTEPTRSSRPVVTSSTDRPPSPVTKVRRERRDDDYEVLPASSTSRRHHERHSSLNTTDPGRLVFRERERDREPAEKSYRMSNMNRPSVRERQGENDRDYGYEYTEAREPKVQDPMYRQRSRRDSYDTTRPRSMIAPDAYIPRSNREPGPPVSTRGFENLGRTESQRHGHRARDDERASRDYLRDDRDIENRKPARPEITLHQPSNDEYSAPYPEEESRHHRSRKSAPEDDRLEPRTRPHKVTSEEDRLERRARDLPDERSSDEHPRRHRHKHHHRDHDHHRDDAGEDVRERRIRDESRDTRDKRDRRDDRRDDGPHSSGTLAGAGAAAAATGLAAEEVRRHRHREPREDDGGHRYKEPRDDDSGHRYKETRNDDGGYRHRDPRDDNDSRPLRRPQEQHLREPERDYLDTSSVSTGLSLSEREDLEYQEAREASRRAKEQASAFVGPIEPVLREQKSYERRPEDDAPRHHRSYRPRRHHSRTRDEDSWSESSASSSSDSDDDRTTRRPPPRVVTPANEEKSEPKPPPKGILRKPREQFPEYPPTEREGVAPHKDDKKKDVPPNARWTKIDRRLVNPEALEQDGIRFNEFVDHVIVLKVMDREEIEKYTQKTAEIREKRRMLMGPEMQGALPPGQAPPQGEKGYEEPSGSDTGRSVRF
ncbi:hypothetical protein ACLMJK_003106 [Lecanora helva]